MPHFMIVLIPYINLLNLSWITNVYVLRNMEPLSGKSFIITTYCLHGHLKCIPTKMANSEGKLDYSETSVRELLLRLPTLLSVLPVVLWCYS